MVAASRLDESTLHNRKVLQTQPGFQFDFGSVLERKQIQELKDGPRKSLFLFESGINVSACYVSS